MMENKQTAVEWLIKRYEEKIGKSISNIMEDEIKQAKAMEREQIEDIKKQILENSFVSVLDRLPEEQDADENGFVDVVYFLHNNTPYIKGTKWNLVHLLESKKHYWRRRFKIPSPDYFTKTYQHGENS